MSVRRRCRHTDKLIRISGTVIDVAGDHLCRHCGETHRRLLFDTPKSRAGERIYPLVPGVTEALDEHLKQQAKERKEQGDDYRDHGLVFQQPGGSPWRPDWISREFTRLMKVSGAAVGLERVPSLKSLRSTAVTSLHNEGLDMEVISRITGHATPAVTREHYLSVTAEATRPTFELLAKRLSPNRSDPLSDPRETPEPTEGGDADTN